MVVVLVFEEAPASDLANGGSVTGNADVIEHHRCDPARSAVVLAGATSQLDALLTLTDEDRVAVPLISTRRPVGFADE